MMEQNSKKGKWLWVEDDKIQSPTLSNTVSNNPSHLLPSHTPTNTSLTYPNYTNSIYNCKMTLKPQMVFVSHDKPPNCIILQFKLEDQKIILTSQKSKHPPAHMSLQPLMESFPYSSPTQPNKLVISEITIQIDDQQIKHPITQEEIYHIAVGLMGLC